MSDGHYTSWLMRWILATQTTLEPVSNVTPRMLTLDCTEGFLSTLIRSDKVGPRPSPAAACYATLHVGGRQPRFPRTSACSALCALSLRWVRPIVLACTTLHKCTPSTQVSTTPERAEPTRIGFATLCQLDPSLTDRRAVYDNHLPAAGLWAICSKQRNQHQN